MMATARPQVCKFFVQGRCKKGDACPYSHDPELKSSQNNQQCKFYAQGFCRHGDNCRFAHDTSTAKKPGNSADIGGGSSSTSKTVEGGEVIDEQIEEMQLYEYRGSDDDSEDYYDDDDDDDFYDDEFGDYWDPYGYYDEESSDDLMEELLAYAMMRSYIEKTAQSASSSAKPSLSRSGPSKNKRNQPNARKNTATSQSQSTGGTSSQSTIPPSQSVKFYHDHEWNANRLSASTSSVFFGPNFDIKNEHIETVAKQCPNLLSFTAGDQDYGTGSYIKNHAIKALCDGCPKLKEVSLWSFRDLTDDALVSLFQLKNISKIAITGNDKITGGINGTALLALAGKAVLDSYNNRNDPAEQAKFNTTDKTASGKKKKKKPKTGGIDESMLHGLNDTDRSWFKTLNSRRNDLGISDTENQLAPNLTKINLQDQNVGRRFIKAMKIFRPDIQVGIGESVGSGFAAQHIHAMMGYPSELTWL